VSFNNLEFFVPRLVEEEPFENFFAGMFQIVAIKVCLRGSYVPPFLSD